MNYRISLLCQKLLLSCTFSLLCSLFFFLLSDPLGCACVRSVPQKGPVGRSWHSFTPVSPDHIFLFGGFTTDRETLSESDILFWCSPKHSSLLKMIACLKKMLSVFQVMLGCTMLAKMNGSLSNTVTQRDQGKSLIIVSTLMFVGLQIKFQPTSVCVKANPVCRQFFRLCCVLQAVAHSMRGAWWGSVCVWRVCQQPVVSTQSCKTQVLPFLI